MIHTTSSIRRRAAGFPRTAHSWLPRLPFIVLLLSLLHTLIITRALAVPLPANAVSWYQAENSAQDALGRNPGTASATTYAAGRTGQALNLTGAAGSFVTTTNNASLQLSAGTVEAWIKTPGPGSSYRGIIVKQFAYGLFLENNNLVAYDWINGGLVSSVNLADNNWHHVALTFTPGAMKIYADGAEVASRTAFSINNQNHALVLGAGDTTGASQNFAGLIDEATIYSRVLSQAEIQSIYTAGATGKVASNNADLSDLTTTAGALSPAFAAGITAYTASVPNATTSVTVTPTVAEANAVVSVNGTPVTSGTASGAISLNVGANTLSTTVTAQDGTTLKTYTITVTRAAAPSGGTGSWVAQTSGTTNQFLSVWGSDANNVWAVGGGGMILKWNGTTWNSSLNGFSTSLFGVWGSDANNIWAVGPTSTILKWNGTYWAYTGSGTFDRLFSVWGTNANNAWAVGESGAIRKLSGNDWVNYSSVTNGILYGVWGSDANNVWAVGGSGTILKWNGTVWTAQTSGTTTPLRSVWGSDADNVWVVGDNGTILKWNGSAWAAQTSGTNRILHGVWGSDANNVWAVGRSGTILKWNGTVWTAQTSGTTTELRSVWGSDADNVWVVGIGGTILKWTTSEITGTNLGPIPDNSQTGRDILFNVTGAPGVVKTVSTTFTFNPGHTFQSDLRIELIAPGGTTAWIYEPGAMRNNNLAGPYTIADTGTGSLHTASNGLADTDTLASGTYRAAQGNTLVSLNLAFAGTAPNGTWRLRFRDLGAEDLGTISQASLTVTTASPGVPAVSLQPNGSSAITLSAADANSPYLLQGSSNLTTWTTLQTLNTSGTGTATHTDTTARGPRYYYRLVPTTP